MGRSLERGTPTAIRLTAIPLIPLGLATIVTGWAILQALMFVGFLFLAWVSWPIRLNGSK